MSNIKTPNEIGVRIFLVIIIIMAVLSEPLMFISAFLVCGLAAVIDGISRRKYFARELEE
jgi:hypothetical protein